MTDRTLLVRAAEIIKREAKGMERAFIVGTEKIAAGKARYVWDDQDAYRDYLDMLAVAAALRKEADTRTASAQEGR